MSFTLHGLAVSSGIAIGQAQLISQATLEVSRLAIPNRLLEEEILRFDAAVEQVKNEFVVLKQNVEQMPADIGALVDLHLMILCDPQISVDPKRIIRERRCNAEWAVVQQMEQIVAQFEDIEDSYLRERNYDVRQVVERVIRELAGHPGHLAKRSGVKGLKRENQILVAHDLSPTDLMAFKDNFFGGFVTDVGGATSHTAILARSVGIPAVLGLHNARQLIKDDETLIVDGTRGVLIVNPCPQVLEEYRLRKRIFEIERSKLRLFKKARAKTLDHIKIELLANIGGAKDVAAVLESGADGIGLFRSEFLFLGRGDMPSEEEQYEAYCKVVKKMGTRPVTIRTFDLGVDKNIHAEDSIEGRRDLDDSSLGMRSVRLSLADPKPFLAQLRAILRTSAFGKVRLLIPMLSHVHQIEQTLVLIEQAKSDLRRRGVVFDEKIELGAMIEVPAAALAINLFLSRLDFVSIGTNDLIQYTLAIDRNDELVAHLYDPLHPAILMLIAHVIYAANKANTPVSVCGELAGDPKLTRLLIGMGLRQLSMHTAQIPTVKQRVTQSDISEIEPMVRRILRLEEPHKIVDQIERLNAWRGRTTA